MRSNIPLIDLRAQHAQVADEVAAGFARVLDATAFVLGPEVAAFEKEFAAWSGVKHCIGVANGTDALELALRANGIGQGDEVILPANTFIATALAVARAGARPVLVDCDPEFQLIDPERIEERVTTKTRAIIPVHLFGQMAPMARIEQIARKHNLTIIEDAAQAHGAKQAGRVAGGTGAAAGISFYPGKNLGAYGDAGGVLTNSDAVERKVRGLRNYGSEVKYHHPDTGFNSRLDTLQAVVLSAKLKRLTDWNAGRRRAAARYAQLLQAIPGVDLPRTAPDNEHVWHLYVIRVHNRNAVLERLHKAGVGAGIHYPVPVHMQGAFAHLGYREGDFPIAEAAAAEILSLPMFAEISEEQQAHVASTLNTAVRET